jgi:hypothetical protein
MSEHVHWIDGRWTDAEGGATFETCRPRPMGSSPGVSRVGGRFSLDPLTELKTIVVDLGE